MPRTRRALALAALAGAVVGLCAFTFSYAEGLSYFSTDLRACANCHVMNDQFASWSRGPHHGDAGCVDCHLPHDFFGKYLAPALELQRKAQWRLDFVAAENSMGFHAPPEAARILAESIDYARQGELAARIAPRPAKTDKH